MNRSNVLKWISLPFVVIFIGLIVYVLVTWINYKQISPVLMAIFRSFMTVLFMTGVSVLYAPSKNYAVGITTLAITTSLLFIVLIAQSDSINNRVILLIISNIAASIMGGMVALRTTKL